MYAPNLPQIYPISFGECSTEAEDVVGVGNESVGKFCLLG